MYDIVASRNGKLIFVFHSTEENIAPEFFCDPGNAHAVQMKFRKDLKF